MGTIPSKSLHPAYSPRGSTSPYRCCCPGRWRTRSFQQLSLGITTILPRKHHEQVHSLMVTIKVDCKKKSALNQNGIKTRNTQRRHEKKKNGFALDPILLWAGSLLLMWNRRIFIEGLYHSKHNYGFQREVDPLIPNGVASPPVANVAVIVVI